LNYTLSYSLFILSSVTKLRIVPFILFLLLVMH